MKTPLHSIGRVAGKHGFNGEIALHIDQNQYLSQIKKGNFLFIDFDGKGVPFLIESVKSNATVVRLEYVVNPEEATELTGRSVSVESQTGSEYKSEFNFVGYSLIAGEQVIGKVTVVELYPAGEMMTVITNGTEILIPLVESWIVSVNEEAGELVMDLPEGLTEL